MLFCTIRCFDDENVAHVDGSVDPVRDKEIIDTELQLKDLETIESRIQKVQKQAQTGGDKQAKQMYDILVKYKDALEQGKILRVPYNLTAKTNRKSQKNCSC